MTIRLVLIIVFLLNAISVFSKTDTTLLYGVNSEYANTVVSVKVYDDFISRKLVTVATDTVDSLGYFELKVPLVETRLIKIPLGYYNGLLYIEANEKYEILLPKKKEKTFVDRLNPYFQEVDVFLGVKNSSSNDINRLLFEFDEIYERYVDENYYAIYRNPNEKEVEQVIGNIEKLFDTIPNQYFDDYRLYKYAVLRYASYMRNSLYISKDYYNDMPLCYQNTAYMDLFNQLFVNYLMFYMNTSEGERIYSDVALSKSPYLTKESFSNNLALTRDSVQELVLLKGIHDAFNTDDFPVESMLIVLDSIANHSKIAEHKKIAKNINEKVLHMREGYPAPSFELRDQLGVLRKTNHYLANYVYLNFCSVESFPSQQDFVMLKELHDKYKTEFKIISISIDDDFEKAKAYFKANDYDWTLLSYRLEKDVLEKYKVKAYPTYYLIDPEGNLVMSPAVSPSENFEIRFFTYMRNVKRSQIRQNH